MALKEKISFQLLVDPDDPSTLILVPVEKKTPDKVIGTMKPTENQEYQQVNLQDGSVYTVNIKNLEFEDGSVYSNKETFITKPSNYMFVEVNDVKDHISGLNLSEESIMNHIIDASKQAMYWAKKNVDDISEIPDFNSPTFQEDYYPFYMFVKHTAMVESMREYYIEMITGPKKWTDTLSDLERSEEMDFDALRKMIDDLAHEAEEWLELVTTITADPKWALRGKYSFAIYNQYSSPYHKISWYKNDYSRGF